MRLNGLFLLILLILSSCGSLKLSPFGCHGDAIIGDLPVEGKPNTELQFTETYYVWNMDYEVRLKDFLKTKNISCNEVKKMRVTIKSLFFVKRVLTVYIQK